MSPSIAERASITLAVIRRQVTRAELGAAVRDGCGRAFAFARARGLNAGRNVAVYWDGAIRLEAGVELPDPFDDAEGIVRSATPSGLVVSATHVGPYGTLGETHAAIREWCAAHGYVPAGPNWEIYGHWQTEWNADPSQIRTDVQYLVTAR